LDETVYVIPQKKSPKRYGNEFHYLMMSKEVYSKKEFGGTHKIVLERKVGGDGK
jgi:hypothetical protein